MFEADEKLNKLLGTSIMVDCCIAHPEIYWSVGVEIVERDSYGMLPPVNVLQYHKHYEVDDSGPLETVTFEKNNFKNPMCVHAEKIEHFLIVDYNGEVWQRGPKGKTNYWEDTGIPQRGIKGIKNIHSTIYAVGIDRSVFRRDGKDNWTHISKELEANTEALKIKAREKGNQLWTGFDCIDGFEARSDLYAAGGNGDVWRFDGEDWLSIDIPLPSMQINAICCAEDGYVYIVGRFGAVLKGREDNWEVIEHSGKTEFSDVVSYQGKVYLASAARLYFIDDKQTAIVQYATQTIPANHGHLYVNHGLMMTTGRNSAAIYDGTYWKVLFGGTYFDEETSTYILTTIAEEAIKAESGQNDSE